jgi:hypothetical protein
MREFQPVPDPSGSLQPPDRWPPTAVGTETPEPEPESAPPARRGLSHLLRRLLRTVERLVRRHPRPAA